MNEGRSNLTRQLPDSAEAVEGVEAQHFRRPGGEDQDGEAGGVSAAFDAEEITLLEMYRAMSEEQKMRFLAEVIQTTDLPSPVATKLRAVLTKAI